MNQQAKKILTVLDAAISPPAPKHEPRQEPKPRPPLTWTMVLALLKFAGLPDKKIIALLDNLSLAIRAELEAMKGYSQADAIIEHRAAKKAAVDGKGDPAALLTREQIRIRNLHIRSVAKARAAIIGREACQIAANVLEAALEKLPAFVDDLMSKEAALFPEHKLPTSPLRSLCNDLGPFITIHIKKLREHPGMVDPANLLK